MAKYRSGGSVILQPTQSKPGIAGGSFRESIFIEQTTGTVNGIGIAVLHTSEAEIHIGRGNAAGDFAEILGSGYRPDYISVLRA